MAPRATPKGEMDHKAIEEGHLPDRYLMGKLPADERARFEEHYVDCPVCLGDLEAVEGLRAGLKELSAGAAAARRTSPVVRFLGDYRVAALLAAACLVAAVLPTVLLTGRLRRSAGELAVARADVSEARKTNTALAEALELARRTRASASLSASVFTLSLTRAAGPESPVARLPLRPNEWTILLLDRPEARRGANIEARLAAPDGRPIGEPLRTSDASDDTLAVGIPPGLLSEGTYVLALEGSGTGPALATYRFRTTLRK